ncbi:hypothetical protein I7I48_11478 [Histoplasma ohiense]|nr:hypothetical protein I7I48_11478 [Histoplasma ohiense (nom. inval.)]
MELSSEFHSTLLDVKQLAAYPNLEALMSMVNEGFHIRHHELFATDQRGRFENVAELVDSLDAVGRCCIITQSQPDKDPRIVACSMIKAYHEGDPVSTPPLKNGDDQEVSSPNGTNGTTSELHDQQATLAAQRVKTEDSEIDIRSITDWELAVVVVRQDPQLSKLGFAIRCVSFLEQDLMERLEQAEKEDAKGAIAQGRQQPLTFWVKATKAINGSYWERRGYKTVRTKTFPKGFWGAYRDFEFAWMKKCILPRAISSSSCGLD